MLLKVRWSYYKKRGCDGDRIISLETLNTNRFWGRERSISHKLVISN